MMALTTDIAGAVELESKATLLSPTGGDTNNGADPNAAPTVSEDVTTTKPPDVTDTPGTDTRTRANAGVGGVDSRENEAATMHGDGARNDDAVVQAKQDEISQARLARHKVRKAAKRRRFRALQLKRRREAGRQEVHEARQRQRRTEASEALDAL
ncbi:hypothetical protein PR002_g30513 [Phytophthora rubi]|uniref:Uncharacterized protein n=1 Tax=Phytophthora rubi TaxID=129364 RepID=A0A6A3GPG3_9STRA|nr:hypothetical protein PR002_g30513 [Phytophthora rubi]